MYNITTVKLALVNCTSIDICSCIMNMYIYSLGKPQKRLFLSGQSTKAFNPPPPLGLVDKMTFFSLFFLFFLRKAENGI